ncbi:MAG: carboxylesterase [Coxiellaceae bacterium]|nr:carboxylesterase [Coxiellaceae bacterium]
MNTPLQTFVIEPKQPANYSVIWMHGLGATANDFEDIVPALQLPEHANVRFVFPQAPTKPITINGGMPMPAWYDIYDLDRLDNQDADGVQLSAVAITALIDMEINNGIANDHIILAGFSQGGAMALHTGLRYPKTLGGIMAMSCYLPVSDLLEAERHHSNHQTPLFIAHGTFDPVLPYVLSELTIAELQRHDYNITTHQYPMGHEMCLDEIKDMSSWLSRTITL